MQLAALAWRRMGPAWAPHGPRMALAAASHTRPPPNSPRPNARTRTRTRAGAPLPFMGSRNGPRGAESAAPSSFVPAAILNQFIDDGFKYVGRIRLAHEWGPRPEAALEQPPAPAPDASGHWNIKAVRCTSDGDVYVGR